MPKETSTRALDKSRAAVAQSMDDLKSDTLKWVDEQKKLKAEQDALAAPVRTSARQRYLSAQAAPGEVQAQMARVAAHEAQGQQRRADAAFKTEMDDLSDMFGKMGKGRKSRKGKGKKKGGKKTRKGKTRRH